MRFRNVFAALGLVVALLCVMALPVHAQIPRVVDRQPMRMLDEQSSQSEIQATSIPVILADDVTPSIVKAMLEGRGMYQIIHPTFNGKANVFSVRSVSKGVIFVTINSRMKWIEFTMLYQFAPGISTITKLTLINELNENAHIPRFYFDSENNLRSEYAFPYDEGLSPRQLLVTMKDFEASTVLMLAQIAAGKVR